MIEAVVIVVAVLYYILLSIAGEREANRQARSHRRERIRDLERWYDKTYYRNHEGTTR